jgi:hypothetical protein
MTLMLSRRTLIRCTALAAPAALVACQGGLNGGQLITLTQTALADATNVIAGLNALLVAAGKTAISSAVQTRISAYVGDAQGLLASIASSVNSGVSGGTVSSIFTDIEAAANGLAPFLPGNPYLLAVQALLPILAAAWHAVAPAGATGTAVNAEDARALLGKLPRPALLK